MEQLKDIGICLVIGIPTLAFYYFFFHDTRTPEHKKQDAENAVYEPHDTGVG